MKRINSFVLTFGIAASYLFEAPTTAQEVCGYAPLCGQNGGTFDWRTSGLPISGNWMGGAEISFSDCCSLKDTKPVESCQIVDPSGESYRYYESSEPICGTGGQDCTDGACSQYYFTIKPNFFHNSQNDACCDSCTCYGDPQCKSFNGTEKTWILCDGREIPDEDSIWSMCRVTERRCSKELDHAGNKCQYLSSDPRGIGWLVGKNGSPCVPNPASPPSYIVMYSVPDKSYKVTLQQGERGIILKVILELSVGRFELSADRCLTAGTNAWNITASSNRLPAFFYFVDLVEGRDIMWNIIDPASGIGLNLRCHANEYEGDSNFYVSRINVEDLSDPVSRRNNTSGFCPTGKLDYGKATTEHTKKIIEGDYCTDGLQSSDFRDIYRAICRNSALPESSVPSCIYHFCSQNYAPLYESIEECQAGFDESIAKGFCKGVTYTENDVQKCIDQWFELGAIETIQQYYDDQAGCHTEYQQSLTTCQSGVVIQYWRSNQWNDEIAIPNDYCGDAEIRLSYCDHPRLFNRIIRVVQKQAGVACGPVYQCSTVDAFRALLYLSKDTPYPTPFPTPLVTDAPSPYPTNYPTFFPTSFPVPQPTPFPTNQPTARNPTPFPTPRPTTPDGNVPTPCPQPYLCQTPETSTDISDGSFSFEMDSCCPVNGCPDLYTPYQNRSKSSNQGYCQGDESYTQEPCKDDFSLQVKVYFSEDAGQECCKTCTCYGDPRCYSFGNVFKEFILCDGRTVPQSGDTADRCVIRRDTCTEQTDHEGHECKWGIPGSSVSVPNYIDSYTQRMAENSFSVAKHGSPCRYDSSVSGVPNILLYETRSRNFILEVEQGERGYIQTVLLQTTNGNFHLSAERCMDGQDWEVINGRPEYRQFQVQKYGFEYLWKVTDIFTGIEVKVRCTGSLFEGKVAHTFINIESIEEPNFDRLAQGSGFCVSGVFPEASLASTDHTDEIRLGGFCDNWNADVTEIMLREIARVITNNPGVTTVGTENAYKKFCQQFFSPGYSSVSRCVSAFLDGKNVKSLITAFCKAVTVDTRVCEEELEVTSESSGYHDAFTEGYEQYVKMFNEECVLDPRQLPSSLADDIDSCETGVLLQWWNPRKEEWITYSAFRDNSGCAGFTVTYTYDSDPQLFKNKLRIYQQHNFAACSTCTHVSAVDAWFAFNEGDN